MTTDLAPTSTATAEDLATVRHLHASWVWGFDKEPDAGPWDFRAVQGRFYDWGLDDARYYDDMDPEHRVLTSAAAYQRVWEPVFDGLREATHRIEEGPVLLGTAELVSSRLVFVARLVQADGTVVDIRTHNSLLWRRTTDGWKIVGDHTSSQPVVDPAVASRLLDELPGADGFA